MDEIAARIYAENIAANGRSKEALLSPDIHRRDADSAEKSLSSIISARTLARRLVHLVQLQKQECTAYRKSKTFAVRSTRRGSDEWRELVRPFVASIVFRSLVSRRFQTIPSFRAYTCQAAVLFVDLSGYSNITTALANHGAHVISAIVNEYLSRILEIVRQYGGDVVKFAGDAILIVWDGSETDLALNVLCAAQCALKLQNQAGHHAIEGTKLEFRMHCGLCCGALESDVFQAPTAVNMQRLYHSVSGESICEISNLVDLAKAGEICISGRCVEYLESLASLEEVESTLALDSKLLKGITLAPPDEDALERHMTNSFVERMSLREKEIEEDFIHPSVLGLLDHGGLSPTQIAQMRNLCILFIAMTSSGNAVNWLMEVQSVLDQNRCPIVQIIDDDKGVHIVAAVNLYEAVPEAGSVGLEACRRLIEKRVGCAVGMAMGATFCGVTGSSSVACRWDITGPPAVRAARLMQYALANDFQAAVDESVYRSGPFASSRLQIGHKSVNLKGTAKPITVYTLSESTIHSAFKILDTMHCNLHHAPVKQIQDFICSKRRSAVVVTGMSLAGKKAVCQTAAGNADFVPFLHVCDEVNGLLQLARTIATWFHYSENEDIQLLARSVSDKIDKQQWSWAHDECIVLVERALEAGHRACFVVDRVQFLDEFSVSLMRGCLTGRRATLNRVPSDGSYHSDEFSSEKPGSLCFLCVHVPFYNWRTAVHVMEDIARSHKGLTIPIITILEADREVFRGMLLELGGLHGDDRWLDATSESSGCLAGYFVERHNSLRFQSGRLWSDGKLAYLENTADFNLTVPPRMARKVRLLPVMQVSPAVAMRIHQIYDQLPPLFQTTTKVLAVATGSFLYKISRKLLGEVLNDLISEGVDEGVLTSVLDEMVEMFLVNIENAEDDKFIALRCPALSDVAFDVCTPIQLEAIRVALLDRLVSNNEKRFRAQLLMAELHHDLGHDEEMIEQLWFSSFSAFLIESKNWNSQEVIKWHERIRDEIEDRGYNASEILKEDFSIAYKPSSASLNLLSVARMYVPPVTLGPMAHSLSVIIDKIHVEWGAFHGLPEIEVDDARQSRRSAADRYLREMSVVESFLTANALAAIPDDLEGERDIIALLATPAQSDVDVIASVEKFRGPFMECLEKRLERLHALVEKLRGRAVPSFVHKAPEPIRKAYHFMFCPECTYSTETYRQDAAEHALMILATMNWKARTVPENMSAIRYQTVARISNLTLKRLSNTKLVILRQQQSIVDFEAFLITTALLYDAQDQGLC